MNYKNIISAIIGLFLSLGIPKNIQKKVNKEIRLTFSVEKFKMNEVLFDETVTEDLPSFFNKNNFFRLEDEESHLGYLYISKAPSKTDEFDYMVILNDELTILKSKVLIYREDYGGEIGSKRWLKQFNGKSTDDALRYGDNIVAISGATISVRSMTNAVNDLLRSLKRLTEKGLL